MDNNDKKSRQNKVTEFMILSGQYDPAHNVDLLSPSEKDVKFSKLRLILLLEKVQALFNSFLTDSIQYRHLDPLFNILLSKINNLNNSDFDLKIDEIAKVISDIDYINSGTAVWLGIDSEVVFNLVHDHNLSKIDPITNRPNKRIDGKVIEHSSYQPLDLNLTKDIWLKVNKEEGIKDGK